MALLSIAPICRNGHIVIDEHMLIEIVGLPMYQVLSHASQEVNMIIRCDANPTITQR